MSFNIAVVSNTSFNIVNFRLGLMHALRDSGHNVIAIAPEDEYSAIIIENNFRYIPILKMSRSGTNPFKELALIQELRSLYTKNRIDVTLQYTIKPNIYGTLSTIFTRTKAICTVTGLGYVFLNKNLSASIAKLMYKFSFAFANKVIFQNEDDKRLFLEKNLVSESKVMVVAGSGIDTSKFNSENFNSKTNPAITFIMIARMLIDKGVYDYVEAANRIKNKYPDTRFLYVGDIDITYPASVTSAHYEEWKSEGKIEFLGHKSDVRPYIVQSDCIVLPSYREGLPRVVLEGMSMSKACIVTDVPGCRHTIDNGISGYLCEVRNPTSLAKAMETYILLSENEKNNMSIQARNKAVQVFDIKAICNQYLKLINSLRIK